MVKVMFFLGSRFQRLALSPRSIRHSLLWIFNRCWILQFMRLVSWLLLFWLVNIILKFKYMVIYQFYVQNFQRINNWDLVDVSAYKITGPYLFEQEHPLDVLETWALSEHLWTRRISMLSCFYFIRKNRFTEPLRIAELLVQDSHDLMHKAVGWMLREIGKRDQEVEEEFLRKHYNTMPRTMLRYAIEKFDEDLRQEYLKGTI